MTNECYGCARRSAEPNCHNAETCAFWAAHTAKQEAAYARKRQAAEIARPKARYIKSGNGRGGMYVVGEKRTKGGGAACRS